MKNMTRSLVLLPVFAWATGALAQLPTVDITMVQTMEGPVEVRIRPDGPFDGLVSSIVFTIRWNDADGASLGATTQESPVSDYIPVYKSGQEQVADGFRYQVFAGFSLQTLAIAGSAWAADEEVVLCRLNVNNGTSAFSIVNDDWTGNINNNGDYFISLNGEDRTGEIYSITTGLVGAGTASTGFTVSPNPASDMVTIALGETASGTMLGARLVDIAGKTVKEVTWSGPNESNIRQLDLSGVPSGTYLIQVDLPAGPLSGRLVVVHP